MPDSSDYYDPHTDELWYDGPYDSVPLDQKPNLWSKFMAQVSYLLSDDPGSAFSEEASRELAENCERS